MPALSADARAADDRGAAGDAGAARRPRPNPRRPRCRRRRPSRRRPRCRRADRRVDTRGAGRCGRVDSSAVSCGHAGLRSAPAGSRREITFETPLPAMDTPYNESAASIVRFWWVTTMNCARPEKERQHLQEAVDVEVVEGGLDLVEDVERARAGEEDREQERERGHRLLAAGEQREALGRLARGRDLDLHAHVVLRALLFLFGLAAGSSVSAPPSTGRGPASSLTSRSAPRPPGKRCSTTSSKFFAAASKVSSKASLMRRSVSRIRLWSSRSAVSRSCALGLELLDVLERLLVLGLRERVDGAELLAAALQALDAGVQRGALVLGSGSSDGSGSRPSLVARRGELLLGVLRVVAGALRLDLAAGDGLAALAQAAWTRDSSAAHSRSSAASFSPAALSALSSASSASTRVASSSRRRLQRGGEALGDRLELLVALERGRCSCSSRRARSARSRSRALGEPALGRDRRLDLRLAVRARALVGRGAALLDDPARVALGLRGLVAGPRGGAGLAVDRVARGVGLGDLGLRGLDRAGAACARPGRPASTCLTARRGGCAP